MGNSTVQKLYVELAQARSLLDKMYYTYAYEDYHNSRIVKGKIIQIDALLAETKEDYLNGN